MDSKELRGLMEAYQQVNAPIDEAVKGESSERRRGLAAERRLGIKPLSAKEGEKYASHKISQMAYTKRAKMGEELDIFDVVLEFLQAEGYAETLEEAEWLMANVIDEEAIDIILGEAVGDAIDRAREKSAKKGDYAASARYRASYRQTKHGFDAPGKKATRQGTDKETGEPRPGNKWRRRAGKGSEIERNRDSWDEGYDYVDEAQAARENPEKYEREQAKKSAPVRGERTPMPPRGDKRREDFEKWYRANVR